MESHAGRSYKKYVYFFFLLSDDPVKSHNNKFQGPYIRVSIDFEQKRSILCYFFVVEEI